MKRKSHKALGCKTNSWKFGCKQNKKKKKENDKVGEILYMIKKENEKEKHSLSKYLQPKKEESSNEKPTKPKWQSVALGN